MRWAAFSSASISKAVAEAFVTGGHGSLFILRSAQARAISRFSMFPEEHEVLFRPNTVFRIDSTLFQASDIGQFYCSVDNFVMSEVLGASQPEVRARPGRLPVWLCVALDGNGPQRRLGRRLGAVAKAVGGGYSRLQMPLKLAFSVKEKVAGHGLGVLEGGGAGGYPSLLKCIPATPPPPSPQW